MKPTTASFVLFIVIIMCGYVVSSADGIMRIAAFILGVLSAALSIYIYWKNKKQA